MSVRERTLRGCFIGVAIGLLALAGGFVAPAAPGTPVGAFVAPAAAVTGSCTGWTSDVVPPTTIRVYRTTGPAIGTVQQVPFRQYVEAVMPSEWGASNPTEALRAGAIAVKQYAWYWTIHSRGKAASDGTCYDVVDTTLDQLYRPETAIAMPSQLAAIASTWTISLRKDGQLFATGYRTGSSVDCGADASGRLLFQRSVYKCAAAGMLLDQILHRYLDPGLQIVRPGSGDSTGDGIGDVVVVSPGQDPGSTLARLYSAGKVTASTATVLPTAFSSGPYSLPLAPAQTVARQLADLTGDRLDDIVLLVRSGDSQFQLYVSPSTGDGFGPPSLWWDSSASGIPFTPTAVVRLVTGDIDADSRPDVGLLVGEPGTPLQLSGQPGQPAPVPAPTALPSPVSSARPASSATVDLGALNATPAPTPRPAATPVPTPTPKAVPPLVLPPGPLPTSSTASLWVLRSTGGGLAPPVSWWSGPLDLAGSTAFSGDIDGDGRSDLVVQVDLAKQVVGGVGLRFLVVRSVAPPGSTPEVWADVTDLAAAKMKTVIGDLDRDGRADIVVDLAVGSTGSQLVGLMSTGGSFGRRTLWTNRTSFRWSNSRVASADVNGDGRGDVVVLYNAGAAGSKLFQFVSTGSVLKSAGSTTDPGLPWVGATPY